MRNRVCVTVGCPSVCLSRRSTACRVRSTEQQRRTSRLLPSSGACSRCRSTAGGAAYRLAVDICCVRQTWNIHTYIHPLNGPLSRTTQVSRTRKVKPIWILLEQETVSGSGISWAICKSAPRSRQITTPAPTTQFLQAGCSSCRPANSVKALKA